MQKTISIIKKGGIGVVQTDTVLGIIGKAFSKKTVDRIYKVRLRNEKKPLIILINKISDLKKFGVKSIPELELKKVWPGKASIIFEVKGKKFSYLHRGSNSLCFRIPKNVLLNKIIDEVGPLVAPSANPEGYPAAKSIKQAKDYFGDTVDFYIKGKPKASEASTILRYLSKEKGFELVRVGAVPESRLRQKNLILYA